VSEPPGLLDDAVDRFGTAVADAAGDEVGQDLLAPSPQCLAEPGDFGNRAGVQGVEDLLGDVAAGGGAVGVVDRADPLVDVPGDLDLAVGSPTGRYLSRRSRCRVVRCSTPVSRVRRIL
jgi:hypothetical protein